MTPGTVAVITRGSAGAGCAANRPSLIPLNCAAILGVAMVDLLASWASTPAAAAIDVPE